MADPIIEQAAAAAASPANDAPDVREARRVEVTKELVGGKLSDADRATRLAELRRITAEPDVVAKEDAARTEADAKVPANERRRVEVTRLLTTGNVKPEERAALTAELRRLVAAGEDADEKAARSDAPLAEQREAYGVEDPTLPKSYLESYNSDWVDWEPALFDVANSQGLDGAQVRGLRDAALDLGQLVGDRGAPATAQELKVVFDKLRIPAASRASLTALWEALQGKPK